MMWLVFVLLFKFTPILIYSQCICESGNVWISEWVDRKFLHYFYILSEFGGVGYREQFESDAWVCLCSILWYISWLISIKILLMIIFANELIKKWHIIFNLIHILSNYYDIWYSINHKKINTVCWHWSCNSLFSFSVLKFQCACSAFSPPRLILLLWCRPWYNLTVKKYWWMDNLW